MKWFRTNIKQGSRLALFALAIQFALSFGHFHASHAEASPGDAAPSPIRHLAGVAARHAWHGTWQGTSNGVWHADASRVVPLRSSPDNHRHRQPADGCSICAVLALTDAMLSATSPDLPMPHAAEFWYLVGDAHAAADLDSAGTAFQPRAPPVA